MKHALICALALTAASAAIACDDAEKKDLAPTASALAADEAPKSGSTTFAVDTDNSEVGFLMDAPIEKIHGEAKQSVTGDLHVDLKDVTKSTGLLKIDLDKLELYQQKREDEAGEFGEKTKNDKQNAHMKNWLEIGSDAPKDVREKNRWAQFKITKIENASAKDISSLGGSERKITADITGDFRLHGRKSQKSGKIEAVFLYEGDQPKSVRVKTLEPISVDLEAHDVRPREAFGKLAQATLSSLGKKVAKQAPITLSFEAQAK